MVFRRPPRNEWLAYVRWRAWFRLPALATCILAGIWGVGYAAVALVELLRSGVWADSTVSIFTGLLLAAVGPVMWGVIVSGELLIARAGVFLGFTFIPWRDIAEFREDARYLHLVTPSVRAYWNGWTGRLEIPKLLFDVPTGFGDRLNVWAHQAAGAN